jgi:hypothetical protein
MEERTIPFGLLFEEPAPQPRDLVVPIYDEEKDLSYVEDFRGQRVPYVEFNENTGTQTATKVHRESTDTDPTDDRANLSVMGTTTSTSIRAESTDTDPQDDQVRRSPNGPLVSTETLTRIRRENTDRD